MDGYAADRVVVVGASAGGPLAVGDVLAALPDDLDAAIVVVLHLMADQPSLLAQVLSRRTSLPVTQAREGELLEAGHVYVAPPDAHFAVDPAERRVALERTPPVHFHRPSIDRAFTSVADTFGIDTIAVILTGMGSDGAEGAVHVRERGGTVLAQDPAEFSPMPQAAILTGVVDQVLPLREIGPAIVELVEVAAA